ncbi:unnamed protein product [Acanthoscelides obtectus]|uniref:Uncharacterized protein n=1 Tax=Acanthoscelides obtectus TaxID=200917 RepID=A0A9P0Q810_ACAOB|nr:unnamed protein product [Acanthoscelides obtectus]CAK1620489.1 hypothetical protein AOBTE_LOCUS402 [Acanthoscelides obtectus]
MAVRPDDPKFEETLLRWNEELDNEPDSDNDGTDYDDHVSTQSDRESTYSTDDSEVECETEQQLPGKVIKGKNGHIWSTELLEHLSETLFHVFQDQKVRPKIFQRN